VIKCFGDRGADSGLNQRLSGETKSDTAPRGEVLSSIYNKHGVRRRLPRARQLGQLGGWGTLETQKKEDWRANPEVGPGYLKISYRPHEIIGGTIGTTTRALVIRLSVTGAIL